MDVFKENSIVVVNMLLYIATTIYLYIKYKFNLGNLIFSIFTLSNVGAFFYYHLLVYLGWRNYITLPPFLYLYGVTLMCIIPLVIGSGYSDIKICQNNIKLIKILVLFFVIISIEPFIENVILFMRGTDYSDLYFDSREGEIQIYTSIGAKLQKYANYSRLMIPVFLFCLLKDYKIYKSYIIGALFVMSNQVLSSINYGMRGMMIILGLLYIGIFIMVMKSYTVQLVKKIIHFSVYVAIAITIIFSAITISRYENGGSKDKTIDQWVLLYISEGPIKFNSEMWDEGGLTEGDVTISQVKNFIGLKTFTNDIDRDFYYSGKSKRVEVFYTFIGDFYSDFGAVITLIIFALISYFFYRTYSRSNTISVHLLLLQVFFVHIYLIGFASNVYRSNSLQRCAIITMIVALLMYFIEKSNKKNYII